MMIAICNIPMKLGEKLRYLREVEGNLRGLGRAMTQQELVRMLRAETGAALSPVSYTHLDVYKRQVLVMCGRAPLSIWER